MATEALAEMMVSFGVDLSSLNSIPTATSEIFNAMAESALSASEEISNSLTGASEGFTAIEEAANNAGVAVEGGLLPGYDALAQLGEASGSAAEEVDSTLNSVNFDAFQGALQSLTSAVDAATTQINDQLATIPAKAEESASKSKSAFSGFSITGMINQVGMSIFSLQNMANVATQTAGSLLEPAMNAEKMQESFTNLTGSAQTASDELAQLDDFAAKTQFKTLDIDAAGAQLLGFGFKAKDIIPDITAVGDNLSAVGKGTPAEIQSVIDIFGKMSTQGKVTAMDINQLGAHGITAMADIESGGNLTTKQLQKMLKDGTLPAKDAIDDLTKGIEKNPIYSGGMAKQSGTLSGIMSTLSSDWDVFMATIMKPALPLLETGLSKLTTLLTDPNFKKFATIVGQDIVNGLITMTTDIGNLVTTGQNLVSFFQHNQTAMDALVAVLITAAGIITGVLLPALILWGIEQMIVAAGVIATAAPFILIGVIIAAVIFGIIMAVQHWGAITAWLTMIWGHVTQFFQDDVAKPIGDLFRDLGTLIQYIWSNVVQFWQDDVVKPFTNAKNDIGDAFSGLGSMVHGAWDAVTGAIKGGINTVIDDVNNFISFIDRIQIHIPSVGVGPLKTPAMDWNGLGIPRIPHLSSGGIIPPGSVAEVGDPGPYSELVFGGTAGASVASHAASMGMLGNSQPVVHVHVHNYIDGKEMTNTVMMQTLSEIRSGGHPIGEAA